MDQTFRYTDEEDRESIISANTDKYLIAEKNIKEGNFLIFSDTPIIPKQTETELLQLALAESIEKQETDKMNNQLALAELLETLIIKGVL